MESRTEKGDFSSIYCLNCDDKVGTYYVIFFLDEDGFERYGAICAKCKKKVKSRKRIIIKGGVVSAGQTAKIGVKIIRNILKKRTR